MRWAAMNFIQAVFVAVWTAFWISVSFVVSALTLNRGVALVMARRIWSPGIIWISRSTIRVRGAENVDFSRPNIFVANHGSIFDIPIAFRVIPVNLHFVAKRELVWVPFLGWFIWATGMIFVDRSDRRRGIRDIQSAGRRIREGKSVIAFPEGTRSRDGSIGSFKRGIFHVALEAGVPIVPVAIRGSREVLPADGFRIRPGQVDVIFGSPMATQGVDRASTALLAEQVRAEIARLY